MTLLIAGHQRSGTSLLRRLCNSHPQVMLTGEFGNFYLLDAPYRDYARFILKRWVQKRNAAFLNTGKKRLKGANMAENLVFVLRYLAAVNRHRQGVIGVATIDAALHDLFPGRSILGDKYPDYAFHLPVLTRNPDLRCLFIFRDPRDVASSSILKARTVWRTTWPTELRSPENIARRWVEFIQLMERYNTNVFPVRYEDLVTQPRQVMEAISTWLGVSPEGFQYNIVRSTSVGKYTQGLTEAEISSVIAIAGPAMERMGYSL